MLERLDKGVTTLFFRDIIDSFGVESLGIEAGDRFNTSLEGSSPVVLFFLDLLPEHGFLDSYERDLLVSTLGVQIKEDLIVFFDDTALD